MRAPTADELRRIADGEWLVARTSGEVHGVANCHADDLDGEVVDWRVVWRTEASVHVGYLWVSTGDLRFELDFDDWAKTGPAADVLRAAVRAARQRMAEGAEQRPPITVAQAPGRFVLRVVSGTSLCPGCAAGCETCHGDGAVAMDGDPENDAPCPDCGEGCDACHGTGVTSSLTEAEVFEPDAEVLPELRAHGARLRTLRKARRWSLTALGDALGLTVAQASGLERGHLVPVEGWDALWARLGGEVAP